MTASTVERQPHKHRAGRDDAVHHIPHADFLDDRSAFVGRHVAAVEACRHQLVRRSLGQQVTGQLFGQELVVRQIPVEGIDDPVTVRPHLAIVVQMQPVRVAVPSCVQPESGHVFAVVRRLQQPVHQSLVGFWRVVSQKGVYLRGSRRQTGQIQGHAADQGGPIRLGRRFPTLLFQTMQDEMVDRIARPRPVCHLGQRRARRSSEGPMLLPRCPLLDPTPDRFDLVGRQRFVRVGRRHPHEFVLRNQPLIDLAGLQIARNDRTLPRVGHVQRALPLVQAEATLPRIAVRTVAGIALVGQDRANIPVKLDHPAVPFRKDGRSEHEQQNEHQPGRHDPETSHQNLLADQQPLDSVASRPFSINQYL